MNYKHIARRKIETIERELASMTIAPERRHTLEEKLDDLYYEVATIAERRQMEADWEVERQERMYASSYGLGL